MSTENETPCTDCKGRGRHYDEHFRNGGTPAFCTTCGGSGHTRAPDEANEPDWLDKMIAAARDRRSTPDEVNEYDALDFDELGYLDGRALDDDEAGS